MVGSNTLGMRDKSYKLRSVAVKDGLKTCIELPLEFEGKRAFVVWDQVSLGAYEFKTRMEIDPRLLEKVPVNGSEFHYSGDLVIPCPHNN
jgi:hypothetical protein